MSSPTDVAGSFRDPSGSLFRLDGVLYRRINQCYRAQYDRLMSCGLYADLVAAGMLVPHEPADIGLARSPDAYQVIRPAPVPFISYPYEWCFSQLKDAALLTLAIQKKAFERGMVLKDCSAYNVQFIGCKPVFIDTLSFEIYREGEPWVAYRQFCQHFLAPLALMAYTDIRLNQLLRVYIDGVPLDLASRLLPARTRLRFSLATHLHLHAAAQARFAGAAVRPEHHRFSALSFRGLVDSLESGVRRLRPRCGRTEWGDYCSATNYSDIARDEKARIVKEFAGMAGPLMVWDLGGNTGIYSRVAASAGASHVVCFDIDPAAVERNYRAGKEEKNAAILPLLLDLTNPSGGIGWANAERQSLAERGPADLAMALALVHHLAISNNVPFERIAAFFAAFCTWQIIEFIPKNDSQVRRLLASRKDIFADYDQTHFEQAFSRYFGIEKRMPIAESGRILYLMKKS